MGWGNCGEDSKGRGIGYAHEGQCDQDGCEEAIDRGLAYKCGDMHGSDVYHCEGYFCMEHLFFPALNDKDYEEVKDQITGGVCKACADLIEKEFPEVPA